MWETRELVFLDEPTAGLDPEARIEVWKMVGELADSDKTVFLTTQHLEKAEQLADRIAILHEGRIIANGTLADLKKTPPTLKVECVENNRHWGRSFSQSSAERRNGTWKRRKSTFSAI